MNQKERKNKRENELKKVKKEIKENHDGVCDHCLNDTATDIAHNIPRSYAGYEFFSRRDNLHYFCRSCHSLLDSYKIYEFAKINMFRFFRMMNYLWFNHHHNDVNSLFYKRMDLFSEQSKMQHD